MSPSGRLRSAGQYVEWLRLAIHEREVPANERVRASLSCFAIAQDHHHAIVVLIDHRLYASSFALLRVAFEAFVRGEWLALCADDHQVRRFLEGGEPPKLDELLRALEQTPAFDERVLSSLKRQHWSAMCAYTHTGGLHVQRWNTTQAIEATYDPGEIESVLYFAEIIASLSVIGFATVVSDEALAQAVLDQVKLRSE
jgi:hypothetical protein